MLSHLPMLRAHAPLPAQRAADSFAWPVASEWLMARVSLSGYRGGMWQIRAERPGDDAAVERLVDSAFGPGRFAKTAYRLREGVAPDQRLSFVAENPESAVLLGAVRFWPVIVGNRLSLLLGPLAVEPSLRGRGIGIALMQRGIEEARALGHGGIVFVREE